MKGPLMFVRGSVDAMSVDPMALPPAIEFVPLWKGLMTRCRESQIIPNSIQFSMDNRRRR